MDTKVGARVGQVGQFVRASSMVAMINAQEEGDVDAHWSTFLAQRWPFVLRLVFRLLMAVVAEAMGTYYLVFVGTAVAVTSQDVPSGLAPGFGFGAGFLMGFYTLGPLSGGHYNTWVTLAMMACGYLRIMTSERGTWSVRDWAASFGVGMCYLPAQVFGSYLAALTLHRFWPINDGLLGATVPSDALSNDAGAIFTIEFVITFTLILVILQVANPHMQTFSVNDAHWAIASALFILVAIGAGGGSGGSMNLARSLGPAIVADEWKFFGTYVGAQAVATLAAVLVHLTAEMWKANMYYCVQHAKDKAKAKNQAAAGSSTGSGLLGLGKSNGSVRQEDGSNPMLAREVSAADAAAAAADDDAPASVSGKGKSSASMSPAEQEENKDF